MGGYQHDRIGTIYLDEETQEYVMPTDFVGDKEMRWKKSPVLIEEDLGDKLIYIAGPYRIPDPIENTRKAIDAWKTLMDNGYTAIVPHLSLLQDLVYPHEPDYWLAYDLRLLAKCTHLLRLPGESSGADTEVAFAQEHNIPVFVGTATEFVLKDGTSGPSWPD